MTSGGGSVIVLALSMREVVTVVVLVVVWILVLTGLATLTAWRGHAASWSRKTFGENICKGCVVVPGLLWGDVVVVVYCPGLAPTITLPGLEWGEEE